MFFKNYVVNTVVLATSIVVNSSYAEDITVDTPVIAEQGSTIVEQKPASEVQPEITFEVVEESTDKGSENDVELEIDLEALTSELDSGESKELGEFSIENKMLNALNEKEKVESAKDDSIDLASTDEALTLMVNNQYEEQLKYARFYLGVSSRDELFALYKILLDEKQPSSEKYAAKAKIADMKQQALINAQDLIYDEVGYFFNAEGPYIDKNNSLNYRNSFNFEEYRVGDMVKTPKELFELAANPRTRKKADEWMRELKVRRYLQAIKEIETLI